MWIWYYPWDEEEEENGCCYTEQLVSFHEYADGKLGITECDWMVPGTVDPND